mmetsp:Transcript_44781/g.112310  ORF Transcript_44781/g.112310 Transcript_44781/m.112310 type:complete len:428 (+) Transcript_44781:62-1345(+)|eukprot:CAMPEP_0173441880 /NCGR_PEP_ID=MMETSP1357-20121228/24194_1 /TAXON_ID=77926 /ORGANISM="Hemiselmis rufescens, Strain PCC563" /LENGTH=427 /DNA_ID=CAMNT_0014407493 /DNA_START=57 /DNA_END=1340 /DNA_ORIENTATION=-
MATSIVVQTNISTNIAQLDEGAEKSVEAARQLFEYAHTSHDTSEQNKEQMNRENAVPALCRVLRSKSVEAQYEACSALSELAFRNERNCMDIVHTPGALESLAKILQPDNGNLQEDACLVVNNCAAFCEATAMHIVRCPQLLHSLKCLAVGHNKGSRNVAVGAINCLSRSKEAAEVLRKEKFVEDTLMTVLHLEGSDVKHEACHARATMAIANLTGVVPACDGCPGGAMTVLSTIVKILGFALDGKKWAGIFFAPFSVLYPLGNLARASEDNADIIAKAKAVPKLVRVLNEWTDGRLAARSLMIALDIISALTSLQEHQQELRASGAVKALRLVASRARGEPKDCAELAEVVLEKMLQRHLALSMGQHARLGRDSHISMLDDYVLGVIMEYSLGGNVCNVEDLVQKRAPTAPWADSLEVHPDLDDGG